MANSLKIIFDVNIWVSAVIGKKVEQQVQAIILQENVEIIACSQLFEELEQTLQKPKLQKYITPERVKLAMDLVKLSSTVVNPYSIIKFCRDDKDDYLLALAKDAQVDFLLTGDEDLLVLKHFEKARIMNLYTLR